MKLSPISSPSRTTISLGPRPYVDEARASLARGDVLSGEEYLELLKIETLRGPRHC